MNVEFALLLKLFSSAAFGISCTESFSQDELEEFKSTNLSEIRQLSTRSGCSATVNLSLQDLYSTLDPDVSHEILNEIKFKIMKEASVTEEISHLFQAFRASGIKAALLKGYAVGRLYAVPECRESSDTDILISKEDEAKAIEIMQRLGYTVTPRTYYSHHSTAHSLKAGTVELHVSLFYDMLYEILFEKYTEADLLKEDFIEVHDIGFDYYTLGITDHLIFLTLHAVEHFVKSGTSVRQIFDILIYTKTYKDSIDFRRYFEILDTLGYKGLLNTFYTLGLKYFGFKETDLPTFEKTDEETLQFFVSDLFAGGFIGKSRDDGGELFRYYGKSRSENENEYKKYLKEYQKRRIFSSIFPSKERMSARFPFAKNTLLYPIGWVCWMFYGLKLYRKGELDGKVKDGELNEEQKKRLDLFSKLGL